MVSKKAYSFSIDNHRNEEGMIGYSITGPNASVNIKGKTTSTKKALKESLNKAVARLNREKDCSVWGNSKKAGAKAAQISVRNRRVAKIHSQLEKKK